MTTAEVIPTAEFRRIADEVLDDSSCTYGATEGEPGLIETVVAHHSAAPEPTRPERLVITSGGMQGLDLAFKLFVDPGDLVVVESPTDTNGSGTALSYGADVLEIPMDEDGMDVDALETLVAGTDRTPWVIYTIPNSLSPSGTTLREARRVGIMERARRWGSVVLDDDPYGSLRFAGTDVPGFREFSPVDPLVFSVRTFSRVLAPGLRVGWVDADPRLRQLLIAGKQAMDTCTNVPNQHIVERFVRQGGYDDHLAGLRTAYRRRKQAMGASIARNLGSRVTTTDPEGGFLLCVTLQGEDARAPGRSRSSSPRASPSSPARRCPVGSFRGRLPPLLRLDHPGAHGGRAAAAGPSPGHRPREALALSAGRPSRPRAGGAQWSRVWRGVVP